MPRATSIARPLRALGAAALVGVGIVAAGAPNPAGACACGVALEASVSGERALVIERPGGEEIILSLDLQAEGTERAAVVLPVPADPEVEAVRGGADPLAYLDVATAPEPEPVTGAGAGDTAAAPPDVDVLGRETVGGYDVARLAAGDPEALDRWLEANGYTLPAGAEPILADYVAEGWRFVAIRLAPQSTGALKPLRVAFDTDQFVYPMRLSQLATEPLGLTLYSLADGEREVEGLETTWSGAVTELDPPPPPELAGLFAAGNHITRMEAEFPDPSVLTADLVIEPEDDVDDVDDDASADAAEDDAADADDDEDELSIGVVALIALGALALLCVAVAWRARRP